MSLLILLAAGCTFGQQGTVMGITGKWSVAGKDLRFGSTVAADTTLACEPGSTIMVGVGDARIAGRCGNSKKLDLKEAAKESAPPGVFERLKSAAENFGKHNTQGLIAAVSRGMGTNLREAVAELRGGQSDVARAFREVKAGDYTISAEPVAGGPPVTTDVHWSPADPLPVSGLKPGVYNLTLTDATRIPLSDAWVLICSPGTFPKSSAQFEEGERLIAQWRSDLNRDSARMLERALLQSLAEDAR
ncbi:MAG TPA: hypothetical protein VGF59_04685 [Bryobacteraceae bacterium]